MLPSDLQRHLTEDWFTVNCSTHSLSKIKTENIFSAKNLQLYNLPGCVSLPESSNQAIQKDEFPLLSALWTCYVAWAWGRLLWFLLYDDAFSKAWFQEMCLYNGQEDAHSQGKYWVCADILQTHWAKALPLKKTAWFFFYIHKRKPSLLPQTVTLSAIQTQGIRGRVTAWSSSLPAAETIKTTLGSTKLKAHWREKRTPKNNTSNSI